MCIICNLTDVPTQLGDVTRFLDAYGKAQIAMADAVQAMHAVSQLDLKPEDKKRYDATHKKLKRIARNWNCVEHTREVDAPATAAS